MTLSAAWIRNVGEEPFHQLVFASDSRLRFGRAWDCCPKVFAMPRSDCLASFVGDTAYAYPLILQLVNTIAAYNPSRERRLDLGGARGHSLRVFNQMRELIHDLPRGSTDPDNPDALFLFGGFDWRSSRFQLWIFKFVPSEERFVYAPVMPWKGWRQKKTVVFAGDDVTTAQELLRERLSEHGRLKTGGLDMEPLEVLRDMSLDPSHPTIGGPPQVAKVYKHLNSQFFAVEWPPGSGMKTLAGRPLLSYEAITVPFLNIEAPSERAEGEDGPTESELPRA